MRRVLLLMVLVSVVPVGAAEPPTRPNVVFILADDLGWADTTPYGSRFHRTPHIDALAKRGLKFTQAYAANPLCSPTRASILTGLYPGRIGITAPVCHVPQEKLNASIRPRGPATQKCLVADSATRLDTRYLTLAEMLRDAGYATAHFGKWHLGPEPYSPLEQGFQSDVPHWPGPGPAAAYVAPWAFAGQSKFGKGTPGEHIEDRMAIEASRFIQAHKDRPFYINYWAFSVHAPYDTKRALIDKYRPLVDPQDPQRNPLYAGMVQCLDDAVGTLTAALDEAGVLERTVIVFFSDNGGIHWKAMDKEGGRFMPEAREFAEAPPTSNSPLRGGKASLYEGGVREPCIVIWPGVTRPGSTTEAMVQSLDFLPTLAEVVGVALPEEHAIDGRSFAPVLRGESEKHRDTILTFFPHNTPASNQLPGCTVRRGDWKLHRLFHDGPRQEHRYELYDLAKDLGETNNVAAEHPDLVRELDALIADHLTETHALVPGPNPDYDANGTESRTVAAADPLEGWKARQCTAAVKDGVLTMRGTGKSPFLGFAAGKQTGPATFRLRVRSKSGGAGKVEWLPSGAAADAKDAQSVPLTIQPGDWQEATATIPAKTPLGITRLYLPANEAAVEVDWIELTAGGKVRRWEFGE